MGRKMKKFIKCSLVLVFGLSLLVGCNPQRAAENNGDSETQQAEQQLSQCYEKLNSSFTEYQKFILNVSKKMKLNLKILLR